MIEISPIERRPTPDGVLRAAKRVAGHVTQTPILPFEWQGKRLWVKAECLQESGSFKLRGAMNRLLRMSEEERRRGVVAFSSGNHAQGIAIAAQRLGMAATIVMPADAPAVKRAATEAAGAKIVEYDRHTESREAIGARLAEEYGAILVPSFDDVDIIEGQGSAGIEIGEQMRALAGGPPEMVLVCCGGGGLSAGVALALPDAEIVTVEPDGWDDMARSIDAGMPVPVGPNPPRTLCDALQTPLVSDLTLNTLRAAGARGISVTEEEIERAMLFAHRNLRLVVEPGGAVALAAVLAGKAGKLPERCVVLVSGGNVDPALYAQILARQAAIA